MKKIVWTSLIASIIISGLILNMGNFLQNSEADHQDYPVGSSSSDFWSKIVKEGRFFPLPYCELVNGSLYVIGRLELDDGPSRYIYVSKFNTSGHKEWEFSVDVGYTTRISYVFDDDNNLFILKNAYYSSDNVLLIKLNSSGALLFLKEFNLNLYDASLVLGENNSVLIVEKFYEHPNPDRFFILKFNNDGQFLWNITYYNEYDYNFPYIWTDFEHNIYLYFKNNSLYHLAKINGSGSILWQKSIGDRLENLIVDSNDNIYITGSKNYSTGYILKLNSTGNQVREILIEDFSYYDGEIWLIDDLFVFNSRTMSILCFDLNLDQKWNFSLSDYITPHYYFLPDLAKDSHDNIYIVQLDRLANINLVKISNTGEFLSLIYWGGISVEEVGFLHVDSDINIYFICNCEYSNFWGDQHRYTVIVKNPVNGGTPPEVRWDLDERDYFLFSVVGIACIISLIVFISILRSNKKRIS